MARRRRRRPLTITLPRIQLAPRRARKTSPPRRRSNTVTLTRWGGRWAWRGARFTGRHAYRGARHASANVSCPPLERVFRMRSLIAEHGWGHTFVVQGGRTHTMADIAQRIPLDPTDTAAVLRHHRHRHAMWTHMLRHDTHHPHVAAALDRSAERVRQAEFDHYHRHYQATRQTHKSPNPTPTRKVINMPDFDALSDPSIDPMEFDEQLIDYLREAAAALGEAASSIDGIAEYFGGVPNLDSGVVNGVNGAAEGYRDAATAMQSALAAAESAYGDFEMPRFDQVS